MKPKQIVHIFHTRQLLHELECQHVLCRTQPYYPHLHPDKFEIRMLLKGVEDFYCRRSVHRAVAGDILIINPDEPHSGNFTPGSVSSSYRIFYICSSLMTEIYSELPNSEPGIPYFPELITQDQELLEQLCRVHKSLESPNPQVKSDLASSLRTLIERYSRNRPEVLVFKENNPTAKKIEELKEYLTKNYAEREPSASLGDLFCQYLKPVTQLQLVSYFSRNALVGSKVAKL